MPDPTDIALETLEALIERIPALADLSEEQRALAARIIEKGINRETQRSFHEVYNSSGSDLRNALLPRLRPQTLMTDFDGKYIEANIHTPHWSEWYPGLDNADQTLGEIMDTLPGFPPGAIPPLVRLFENPASPIALKGACTLTQHDAIHVLLGRGLVDQDEAFVIGFTAGAAGIQPDEIEAYKVALQSYDEPYRIVDADLDVFEHGIEVARQFQSRDLHRIDVDAARPCKLAELRARYQVDVDRLRSFYRIEQKLAPGSPASARLPV